MKIKAAKEFFKILISRWTTPRGIICGPGTVVPVGAALCLLLSLIPTLSAGQLQYLKGHVPDAVATSRSNGLLPATNFLRLAIGLPLRNRPELTNLLAQIYNPHSTNYHHFLTSAQFAERFGPTVADYQSVQTFANANGLQVTATHANRALLDVAGSVSQIEQAFHVHLRLYPHPREARNFYAPDTEPSLNLSVPILHISGLDNFIVPHPMNLRKTPLAYQSSLDVTNGSGPDGSYWGNDFRNAYVPGTVMTGLGQKVALFQMDSGFYPSDITSYENQTGLPNVPVTPVLLDGYNGGPGFANDECSLDIEMAISMAPGLSQVLVYEGSVADDILNQMATDDSAQQLSSSYAFAVDPSTEQAFQQFGAQGQSFFNASGDANAWVGGVTPPSDDPNITIVGGTTLATTNGLWLSEQVWRWNDTNGSGGGISTQYPIPYWQQGVDMTENQGSTSMRNIPDVALTADNVYVMFGNGTNNVFGGTSCASPLWAGFAALMNQQAANNNASPVGFVNPTIYNLGQAPNYTNLFHDIIIGNNTNNLSDDLFFAVPGYDLCTGWGTPAGQSLIDAMVGPANPTPAYIITQPQSQTVTIGANVTFSVLPGGLPPFEYQWSLNGTNLVGATNEFLTLDDVQTNQAGNYEVVVTNEFGPAYSSTAVLNVSLPLPCDPVPAGLISWWPGQDNANDVIGTNNGVLAGSIGFAPGEVGDGFFYPDPTAYVRIPASASLDVGGATGSFTVEAWINCSTTSQLNPIFEWNTGDGTTLFGLHFYVWSDGTLYANLENTSGIGQVLHPSSVVITAGTFYHVALTYDYPSGIATIYCDGNVIVQQSVGQFTPETSYDLYLGHRPLTQGATYTFSGVIDEPSLYNRALAPAEIAAIYNAGSGGKCLLGLPPAIVTEPTNDTVQVDGTATFSASASGSAPLDYQWMFNNTNIIVGATNSTLILTNVQTDEAGLYSIVITNDFGSVTSLVATLTVGTGLPCDPPPSGLVSWWPGEGNADDLTGINNGVLEGGIGFGEGEVGLAFSFMDASNYVLIPASTSLDVGDDTGSFTLEAWINCSTTSQLNPIFEWNKGDGVTTWGVHFYVWSDGTLYANLENTSGAGFVMHPSTFAITPGTFYHVALTYDYPSGTLTIYCNGNVIGQANAGQVTPETAYDLYLGHRPPTGGETYTFSGILDEPSLYNRALAQSEIAAIFAAGAGGKCQPNSMIPPSIFAQPTNETATEYGTTTFTVLAEGSGPLSYQWFFNQTYPIVAATNATLILTNLQPDQAGSYSVMVTNLFGSITSSNALLTLVAVPPTITNQPANELVTQGNTATFTVVAIGSTPLNYQWTFKGTNLSGATNALLQLNDVQVNQAGAYRVTVTNYFGSVISSNAVLTVTGTPPTFVVQPASQSVRPGNSVVFSTEVSGTSPLSYLWSFQGAILPGATNYFLQISGVQASQAGNYNVVVTNAFGQVLSSNAVLTVLTAPSIVTQPSNQIAAIGSSPVFSVTASGPAPLFYQWIFNGTSSLANATNATLTLTNVQTANAGSYSVQIINAYGQIVSSNASLGVFAPPTIIAQPTNLNLVVGSTATFKVVATGATNLVYQWYWNTNTLLRGSTNATLTLSNVQITNDGVYTVIITNLVGSAVSSNAMLAVNLGEHFVWSPIPSPRFVDVPFTVTIQAQNLTNGVVTNFTGTVNLTSTVGLPVQPAVSGPFLRGIWTGSISVRQPANGLVLQANDAFGDIGLANPINVVAPPALNSLLDHNFLLLFWPTNVPGFMVQTSPRLNSTNWVLVNGGTFGFGNSNLNIMSLTGTNAFFRLWYTNP